jgi:hypothetical protein
VLGLLLLLAAVLILYAGRHLTFFYDEWNFILQRRGGGVDTYLDPHNGHLVLFPVIVYKVLFALVGLRHYTPYLAVMVALHLLSAGLLYLLVRRGLGPWLALAPTALLLFMGSAYQDLLWPFEISLLTSVAGGLGAMLCLQRRSRRWDGAAALLLAWSLTGSAVGIPFLAAAAVVLIAQRGPWTRLWVVVAPAALFAVWYLGWGTSEPVTSDAVLGAPQYVADAAAGTLAGIAGLASEWGPPLAVAAVVAILLAVWRRNETPSAMLLGAAAGVLSFWLLAAVTRAESGDPTASRYLYVGAVFIALIASEASAGATLPRGWAALGVVLLIGAIVGNLGALRAAERSFESSDASVRASLAAVEVAAPVVAPTFVPEPLNAPQVTAGPYLAAVRDLGSPALTLPELERAPAGTRSHSDQVLEQAERLAPVPVARAIFGTSRPMIEASSGGRVVQVGLCDRLLPTVRPGILGVGVPPGRELLVHAAAGKAAPISLRRLAATFGAPLGFVAGGTSDAVRFPADRAPGLIWHVDVSVASAQAIEVCVR